jgi:hypothetical protein
MRKRPALLLLIVVFFAWNVLGNTVVPDPTKRKGAGPLFRIRRGEKWGFMDRQGKIMIQPRFDGVHDFFRGLAGVLIGEKWGFANEKGEVVIPPRYDFIGDFLEGLAPTRIGRKWGFIDTKGRMVVEPRFQGAGEFHEGLARVYLWEKAVCTRGTFTNEDAAECSFVLPDWVHVKPGCFPQGGGMALSTKPGGLRYHRAFSTRAIFLRVSRLCGSKRAQIANSGTLTKPVHL